MYDPPHFAPRDPGAWRALVAAHPLAAIVVATPRGFEANHVPLLLAADDAGAAVLRGHVSRANPVWKDAVEPVGAVAIFRGAEGYVSPSAYASKAEHGRVVPTWNYQVVHAHGRLRAIDDPAWLRAFVESLTDAHERGRAPQWHVADAPGDYVAGQLRGIVGLELAIERIEAKWKLGQNRSRADREGTIEWLGAAAGGGPLRDAMRESLEHDPSCAEPGGNEKGRTP